MNRWIPGNIVLIAGDSIDPFVHKNTFWWIPATFSYFLLREYIQGFQDSWIIDLWWTFVGCRLLTPGLDNTRLFMSLTAGAGTRCMSLLSSSLWAVIRKGWHMAHVFHVDLHLKESFSIGIFLKSYGYLSFLSFTICILFHSRHTSFHCGFYFSYLKRHRIRNREMAARNEM